MRKVLIATAVLSSGVAFAHGDGDSGSHEYISILPAYEIPDGGRTGKRNGLGFSILYGHSITPHIGVEINGRASQYETGPGAGTDFYSYGGTADLVYTFNDRSGPALIHPFVLGSVGGTYDDVIPDSQDGWNLTYGGGLGFVTKGFYKGVRLRVEGRYIKDEFRDGREDYRGSVGIEIPLGGTIIRTVTAPAEPPKVVEIIKEVPRPFIDTDGDTVSDDLDQCPDTPKGLKVDAMGCVIPDQIIELRGVTFEFDKARLTPNAETVLDNVVKAFVGQQSLKVEIGGHTDSKGSDAYNLKLSQARANSVRTYLIGQGAKADQVTAVGYGESKLLIKPEVTPEDYELNRRVEFKVIGK